jgi:hypothetical protein
MYVLLPDHSNRHNQEPGRKIFTNEMSTVTLFFCKAMPILSLLKSLGFIEHIFGYIHIFLTYFQHQTPITQGCPL